MTRVELENCVHITTKRLLQGHQTVDVEFELRAEYNLSARYARDVVRRARQSITSQFDMERREWVALLVSLALATYQEARSRQAAQRVHWSIGHSRQIDRLR